MKLSKEALKKYADGTTYRAGGKTYKRVSFKGTKRGDNYCARSSGQKQTEKVRVRRKAWGCRGKKSIAGIGNPCWSGYEQFGMKTKAGRSVPNCVKVTGLGGVKRYYFNMYGYYYSLNENQFIDALKQGAKKGFVNLEKFKDIKNKPNSFDIINITDFDKDDFKQALKDLLYIKKIRQK